MQGFYNRILNIGLTRKEFQVSNARGTNEIYHNCFGNNFYFL